MYYNEKMVMLKDGTECILRSLGEDDSEAMIEYLRMIAKETEFLIRYPEEIQITVEEERDSIKATLNSENEIMITAFIDNEIAGNARINCFRNHIKLKHRSNLAISVIEKHWGKGIGDLLIKELIKQSEEIGFEQIELGVFSDNIKAIELYKKNGFEIWGKRKNAFKLKNGSYNDEIIMGKFL